MKEQKRPLLIGKSQVLSLLLCAAAAIYLGFFVEHQTAGCAALCIALVALALVYIVGTRVSVVLLALTWVGLLVYELLTPPVDTVTLALAAVWMIVQIIALSGQNVSMKTRQLQDDFSRTYDKRLMLLDEGTELRSMRAYLNDAELYMRISRRHALGLALMTWRIENADTLCQKLGNEDFAALRKALSDILRSSVRTEDMVYMLDEENCLWGSMMLTDVSKLDSILSRIKPKLMTCFGKNQHDAQIEVRWAVFDPEADLSPLKLLEEAKSAPVR